MWRDVSNVHSVKIFTPIKERRLSMQVSDFRGKDSVRYSFLSHQGLAQGTSLKSVHGAAPRGPTNGLRSPDPFIATIGNARSLPTSEANNDQHSRGAWKTGQMPFDKWFPLDSA